MDSLVVKNIATYLRAIEKAETLEEAKREARLALLLAEGKGLQK